MLLRFSAENDRSIFGKQELSLIKTALKDREDGLIDCKAGTGGKTLPAAIIYGANASGKSNVISALTSMRQAVLYSHSRGEPKGGVPRTPFALDDKARSTPTTYTIDFVDEDVRYHYGFEATDDEFSAEWLYSFPEGKKRKLFERTAAREISFGDSLKGRKKVIADLMRPNSLYLSTAAQNDHEQLSKLSVFFDSLRFNDSISVASAMVHMRFSEDDVDKRTIDFLNKIGTGVIGYRKTKKDVPKVIIDFQRHLRTAFERASENNDVEMLPQNIEEESISIELAHRNSSGENEYFDLENESAGTRRLLILLAAIFRVLERGSVFVIDELDASLHTQACEAILALFFDKRTNPKGAQLIATTHDTNLMLSNMLRRDQIWFTEKDSLGATELYPLSDIQTRQSDNIERGYLQGRYGAIPYSGSIDDLFLVT